MKLQRFLVAMALIALALNDLQAAPLVTTYSTASNQTNLGPGGLNLGKLGYWFPNFGVGSGPTGNQPVDQNDRDSLPPGWMSILISTARRIPLPMTSVGFRRRWRTLAVVYQALISSFSRMVRVAYLGN